MQVSKTVRKWFAVFALPTTAAFVLAFVIPFVLGLYLSFTQFTTVNNARWVGLDNYRQIFDFSNGTPSFLSALGFSLLFTVVSVVTVNVFAFALAYLLTKAIRGVNIYRAVFFVPNLIGGIVLGYVWQLILNAILQRLFESNLTTNWLYGFWGLVILTNWQMIGYMMVIYIAGIQNIPGEVVEAAEIDGASSWTRLFRVTIPMMAGSFTICLFLTMSNCLKLFDQNLALTNGAPLNRTTGLALDIFNTFYNQGVTGPGIGQAKAVIFFIFVAVIAFLQLRLTRSKEVEG